MITDIFARRYEGVPLRPQYFSEDNRFMNQAAVMIGNPLWISYTSEKVAEATEAGLQLVHNMIALELGREFLSERWWFATHTWNGNTTQTPHKNTYAQIIKAFLVKIPEDVTKGDTWVKERLSLIELAFRSRAAQIAYANQQFPSVLGKAELSDKTVPARGLRVPGKAADGARAINKLMNDAFAASVYDLNERMRLAGYKLHYHNGFVQLVNDEQVNEQIAKPFWELVSDLRFTNVDIQIKEAIDRRDSGDRTAAFHAVCALESCIKIISEVKGWTTGNEGGASSFVDNLVSKANGRFIEVWEAEILKKMFATFEILSRMVQGKRPCRS